MDEYIKKSGAIMAIQPNFIRGGSIEETVLRVAQAKINELPPADVAPVVHGRWEPVEDFDGDGHWMCTNCGVEWVFNDGSPEENEAYHCPRCGAKMDGHTTHCPTHGPATESEVQP